MENYCWRILDLGFGETQAVLKLTFPSQAGLDAEKRASSPDAPLPAAVTGGGNANAPGG